MWCPKCKNEYVEGVTTCVDCGCELVDELPAEIDLEEPQIIGSVTSEELGNKYIRYLRFSGIYSCGLIPHDDADGFDLAVRYEEKAAVLSTINSLNKEAEETAEYDDEQAESETPDLEALAPFLDEQLAELQDEEANELLSDLRTEASTVYVNKKDKFTDLKFSGYSFLLFAVIGYIVTIANAAGIFHIFNTYSTAILAVVFTVFLWIGISSLRKAGKVKRLVNEEEDAVERVQEYMDEHFTDEYLASLSDSELSEEEDFFHVTELLKQDLTEQFPLFSKGYIDQLVDDMYGEFCDKQASDADEPNDADEPDEKEEAIGK